MKKLIASFYLIFALTALSFAQTSKTAAKTTAAKPAAKAETAVVLKKDGTADKRYTKKAAAAGPLKKDGTADKRYKANKRP